MKRRPPRELRSASRVARRRVALPASPPAATGPEREAAEAHARGLERMRRGDALGACAWLERAVEAAPAVGSVHAALAEAYRAAGEVAKAEAECLLALRCDPGLDRAMNLLGLIRMDRGELEAALEPFLGAIRAKPPCPEGLVNAAVAFNRLGDHERSIACSRKVLALDPTNPLAWTNLGMALRGLGRRDEARNAFVRAGDFPPARFNLGYHFLQEDDLARGLPLLELRRSLTPIGRGLRGRAWAGGARPGRTLLVAPEQGLGDTILMSQFFPALVRLFREVVVLVQKPLGRLLSQSFPGLRVVTDLDGVAYDEWCPMMSLPHLLGIRDTSEIPRRPWLRAALAPQCPSPAETAVQTSPGVASSRRAVGPLRVGLNWAGNPLFAYDAVRSTRLERLEMLLRAEGVQWISLHKGHREEEADRYGLPSPLRGARDFLDTAVVLADLDLVISTETAVPNLSAALGVPTCVLCTPDPDWRWRSWYEGVTICRQETAGNWFGAIAGALGRISEMIDARDSEAEARAA